MSAPVKLSARFRPTRDMRTLTDAVSLAWNIRIGTTWGGARLEEVGVTLLGYIEQEYPPTDMAMLERYGCAKNIDAVFVRVRGTARTVACFDRGLPVRLPRGIAVPSNFTELTASAIWFSEEPFRGCNPAHWNGLTDAEKAEIVRDQDARERLHVPAEVESYFAGLATEWRREREEHNLARDFPSAFKRLHGAYPTWRDILAEFPVIVSQLEIAPVKQSGAVKKKETKK